MGAPEDRHFGGTDPFLRGVLQDLMSGGALAREDSVLVVCGGETDADALRALGFGTVTISNIDERVPLWCGDYAWSHQHAEGLTFPDGSFDQVLVHSGLHHLRCPLKGLTEMYRVARKGIVGFEPNLNVFTRLGVRFGFGQEYETAAVFYNECTSGGVENSAIPNYVYRFRRDDIIRIIHACAPVARHQIRFWFSMRFPNRLARVRNPLLRIVAGLARRPAELLGRALPCFANNVAFHVRKPDIARELHPWLRMEGDRIAVNTGSLERRYRPAGDDPGGGRRVPGGSA